MVNQVDNNFSWVIKNFNSLRSLFYSDPFCISGCKWQLIAYPQEYDQGDYLSLFLEVYKHISLPRGWKRHARFSFTIVNQNSEKHSKLKEKKFRLFNEETTSWGFPYLFPLDKLHDEDDSGFLVNGELKILVQVDVLPVIGKRNKPEEASQPLKKVDQEIVGGLSCDLLDKTQELQEGFEVYGFLLLPSQVESVKRIFKSHPDIASKVRTKSQHLRKTYINVLLGLIETLCQSPEVLTDDDLKEASIALFCLVNARFRVDWLAKKLHQVLEKKKTVKSGEARLLEIEEELNKKTQDLKDLLEKETEKVAAAKTPLSFDDFL